VPHPFARSLGVKFQDMVFERKGGTAQFDRLRLNQFAQKHFGLGSQRAGSFHIA
jgi:hypothetical protein